MRRICVFSEIWESGGIESFLTGVLSNIDTSNMEIDVVVARLGESVFTQRLIEQGVSFYELSGNRNRVFDNVKALSKRLAERHYDVIHANVFHGASLLSLALAKRAGVPVRIAHSHCVDLRKGKLRWAKMLLHAWACRHYAACATRFLACSRPAADFMFPASAVAPNAVTIVPSGLDTSRFAFSAHSETIRKQIRERMVVADRLVLGHVGRLYSPKNQTFVLKVFAELLRRRPGSRLLLIGEGEDRGQLEREAASLGIQDDVVFVGVQDHVEHLLWAMDVFIFPSVFEGFGIAAVEAQTAGLPVVCSDRIPNEACILPSVKRLSLDAGAGEWAEAVIGSRNAVAHRGECAAAIRRSGFDIKDIAQQIEQIYKSGD